NDRLTAAAQTSADDMAARNYWSHYTPQGNPPWVWVTAQGYAYQALAQNLAAGFSDEQSTINGWLASPPHRENLLNPAYSDVGFGYANNPNYTSAGGGPMTVVVAFYGQPQVLAAKVSSAVTASTTPTSRPPAFQSANQAGPAKLEAASIKTSHLQLAEPKISYGRLATTLTLLLGISLGLFWISRHLRAIKRFILHGERYAAGHPLTDLALIMIACLLFILSQTAGLIQ
ncbi:MAG TPA: CAP domain-containing protein, partial [Candidatus Saccharimonadales bacterium]|nr:CAP domain-containing protein [Candidatus Saccharimonadales bacterium]